MSLYREWAQRPQWRKGLMVSEHALNVMKRDRDPGYMSVFMFDEEAAKAIEAQGHSRGMDNFDVYSDSVIIDIDTGSESAKEARNKLKSLGLAFQMFRSGGKGYHFVIPLKTVVSGKNVPYSQKKWVESLGISYDPSIYKASALISLVGRIHPRTGAKKEFVLAEAGSALDLVLLDPPAPKENQLGLSDNLLKQGLIQLATLASNPPLDGERHMSIWQASRVLYQAGMSFETSLDLLTTINNSWPNPKEVSAVEVAVRGGYRV